MGKLWKWIKSGFRIERSSRQKLTVCFVEETPLNPKRNIVYIVGENNFYWMAGLLCPCGCGDFIHLNLLREANPRWKFKISKGYITISPSVWRTKDCESHFFISRGKIIWAYEYQEGKD